MQSINFDDGRESFAINGDETRVIRFNPADPNLLVRCNEAIERLATFRDKIPEGIKIAPDGTLVPEDGVKDMDVIETSIQETNEEVRRVVNHIFLSDVYDTIFAGQSPFCPVGGGQFLIEAFMGAIEPVIRERAKVAREASEQRMNKYLAGYK